MFVDKNGGEAPEVKTETTPKYRSFMLKNFAKIPQVQKKFSEEDLFNMMVVGTVLPFKTNNYVVDHLIDWSKVPDDPIFKLTFPQKDMLKPEHFDQMAEVMKNGTDDQIRAKSNEIRMQLNPHPAGQMDYNVPVLDGEKLPGMQHKYQETALFFPKQSQTCHAYCTFCFRWPQFVGMNDLKFAMKDIEPTIEYIRRHPEISDILFTGGDPMIMNGKVFDDYVDALINANLPNLKTIRIGTKALGYWPYKFLTDKDADIVLKSFEKIRKAGIHVAFMAHFNHYQELQTEDVKKAIRRINDTGAQIRTQSPIFRYINDSGEVWAKMWQMQVSQRVVPYYIFMPRDTGAHHYFSVTLEEAWNHFRDAYKQVSGLGRTVRGPVMSCGPGKVQMLGVTEVKGEKVFALRFIQGRNPDWVHRPFFAEYDPKAEWITDLKPAFGEEKFFFEDELQEIYKERAEIIQQAS